MSKGREMRQSALLLVALLFASVLQFGHLPAAWLFGPLVASALFAVRDWQAVELPRSVYIAAQAVVGTALGAGFSPATLLTLPRHFSIFAFAVIFIVLTSLFNGWILTRSTRLDVATAFLGTMPGGAGEMAAMSDSLGADSRLVVIMQYTRLLLILASLALATPFLSHHSRTEPGRGSRNHRPGPRNLCLVEDCCSHPPGIYWLADGNADAHTGRNISRSDRSLFPPGD